MRTKMLFLLAAVLLLAASPVLAQAPSPSGMSSGELKALGEVVGLGIACGLCGVGQGRAVAGAVEGMARNPGVRGPIQIAMIIGLVFIESLAIYTVALAFTR
jgi:F-type H+-transporting ATPase subunit c